jgi:hypothetical protein
MAKTTTQVPGSIGASDLYTIGEFKRRLGLSSYAMWQARRNGLKIYTLARQRYVLGKDYITHVEAAGKLSKRL